jgi:hypothetical protein
MKITPLRTLALGAAAVLALVAGSTRASAFVDINVGAGGPPPPVVEHRWAPPYRGAVWIGGHYEWRGGQYVWVGGYYDYPPRPGARWIPAHYAHRDGRYFYRPGHWRY